MPNACDGVFNSNVLIFDSNCAEGLHFSAFSLIQLLAFVCLSLIQGCRKQSSIGPAYR